MNPERKKPILIDADKLDGLGAIGVPRFFMTVGLYRQKIYSEFPSKVPDRQGHRRKSRWKD